MTPARPVTSLPRSDSSVFSAKRNKENFQQERPRTSALAGLPRWDELSQEKFEETRTPHQLTGPVLVGPRAPRRGLAAPVYPGDRSAFQGIRGRATGTGDMSRRENTPSAHL